MKNPLIAASLAALLAAAPVSPLHAAALDLAKLTCGKYESEVLAAAPDNQDADSIDTVMWLFGYSVAKSGKHVLYTDALAPFGFALDGECKTNPNESMLDALSIVKPETSSPMDISATECASFATRHKEFARTDTESANTIMMWLFGFAEASSGGRSFDAAGRPAFEAALMSECTEHPHSNLLEAIKAAKKPPGKSKSAAQPRSSKPAGAGAAPVTQAPPRVPQTPQTPPNLPPQN
jgi:hypothetical protein